MALKGTTVIELTNVKTGEVERYEEHNLVTQALAHLHKPIGNLKLPTDCLTSANYSGQGRPFNEPLYPRLLGGLVLWDKAIVESDTTLSPPKNVSMVGCAACDSVNTTTSPCRGSYNATESYLTNSSVETSMKFVYDFATNQANGNINCISLTSYAGGKNGFGGNNNGLDFCGSYDIFSDYLLYEIERPYKMYYSNQARVVYIDPDNDVFYEVASLSTTTLRIYKCRANIHQRSVFKNMYTSHELLETISITLPTTLSGTNTWVANYDADNDLLYIVVSPSASSVAASGTFYVVEVNMATFAATVHTMTNMSSTLYVAREYLICYNGHLYYNYSSVYIYKFSLADSSRTTIRFPSGTYYTTASYPVVMAGYLYFIGGYTSSNNTYHLVFRVNPETNEIRGIGKTRYEYSYKYIPLKGYPFFYYRSYASTSNNVTYYYGYLAFMPMYLATINNLSRTIEKTSDKTMKITYTIQEM